MIFSKSNTVHREVIDLEATPDRVRELIMIPERILVYYPQPIDGDVFEDGSAIYCRGNSGVSLLEVIDSESTPERVVVKVTTARSSDPPFTVGRIRGAGFLTMFEDWEIEPMRKGTRLGKTWRDITQTSLKFLPMKWMVRRGARAETRKIKSAWNAAAKI